MRYVLPHRFFWIGTWGQGLDSSARSVNILLPEDENESSYCPIS